MVKQTVGVKVKKKLRYALIGCGRIAVNHFNSYLVNKDKIELVALCDIKIQRIESLLDKCGASKILKDIKIYKSYKEMIANENLDLVAIATESGTHAEISIYCLKNKINVIVEKPMALSIEDADEMIKLADEKRVKLCVSFQNRFNKCVKKLKEEIETGRFGRLFHGVVQTRWYRDEEYYKQADWRGTWKGDGGCLMNQCIHNIDLLLWIMGDVKEVFAYTDNLHHRGIETEDFGMALLKFKNGRYGMIEGTVNVFSPSSEETLSVFGENGTVKIGGECNNEINCWKFINKSDECVDKFNEYPSNIYGFGHVELYRNMIDAITNDRKPLVDGREGKKALEVVLAIYKSSLNHLPVSFPLLQFSTSEMSDELFNLKKLYEKND